MAASHVPLPSVPNYRSNAASLLNDNLGAISVLWVSEFNRPVSAPVIKCEISDTSESETTIPRTTVTVHTSITRTTFTTVEPDKTGLTSVTSSTAVKETAPATSASTEIISTSIWESSLATTVDTKTSVTAHSTQLGYYTGVTSVPQQSSNLPLGPIIGSALGGLAMILVVVVVLMWMSYSRRKHSKSRDSQEIEPENDHEAVRVGVTQLEGTCLKPELSAGSPSVVPSVVSPRSCEEEPTSFRGLSPGMRYELPTETDRDNKSGITSVA